MSFESKILEDLQSEEDRGKGKKRMSSVSVYKKKNGWSAYTN